MCGGGGDYEIEETPEQIEMAKIAAEQWNDYQANMIPMENEYIKEVFKLRSPEQMEKAKSWAAARITPEQQQALDAAEADWIARGYDPSGEGYIAKSDSLRKAQARGMAGGLTQAGI